MLRRITTFLLFLISCKVIANPELARISDKDGYTNIRSGPGINFNIVTIVKTDDLFYCSVSDSAWWKIEIQNQNGATHGYISRNKVQLISLLPDTEKQKLFQSIFRKQIELAEKFGKTFSTKDTSGYQKTRADLESYNDQKFDPVLNFFADYFCKTTDSLTLNLLVKEIVTNTGSADEWPGDVLSGCFICKPDFVLRQIKRKNANDRKFLIEEIEYGMEGHFNIEENKPITNKEFIRLENLLNTAK